MPEDVEIVNGKVETNRMSSKDGYALCQFTLDSNIEIQHGTT